MCVVFVLFFFVSGDVLSGDDLECVMLFDVLFFDIMCELCKMCDVCLMLSEVWMFMVMVLNEDDENDAKWKALDARVNEYSCARKF